MTTATAEQSAYLNTLEDIASILQKTQTNFKKCPKVRLTEGYVKARLQCMEDYWSNFTAAHRDLTKCTPREQRGILPYFLNEEFYKFEDLYLSTKADMLDMLNNVQVQSKMDETSLNNSGVGSLSGVKLPRIQLPCFSGKYEEFPTYEDLFTSLVHNSTILSNVQKLHYLKTSVTGEAEALLRHIQITDCNYKQAWDLLKSRYGNKRLITTSLLKRLFNQRKIVNQSAPAVKLLLDTTTECLHSLKNVGINIDSWDPLIVFLVVQKLDMLTHKEWEEHAYSEKMDDIPQWASLQTFLESKFRTLELVSPESTKEKTNKHRSFHVVTNEDKTLRASKSSENTCVCCKGDHYIYHCKEFGKLSVEDRHKAALKHNLCFNCLIPNHNVFRCRQRTSCRICKRKHHSLLHQDRTQTTEDKNTTSEASEKSQTEDKQETKITAHYSREQQPGRQVLLATALVDVKSSSGESHVFRALIDQGSEASFVTARTVAVLGLKRKEVSSIVSGIGEEKQSIKHKVNLPILTKSRVPIEVKAYVMKTISSNLPTKKIKIDWAELHTLNLADPSCYLPGKVDILLGADIFSRIIQEGLLRLPNGLIAQKTCLGWILSGQTKNFTVNKEAITNLFVREDNDMLKKFWEIETDSYTKKKILTREEEECELIYKRTTVRDEEGRYIVQLPLKQTIEETIQKIGDTKQRAITRFQQLERKFERDNDFKKQYKMVIDEYLEMGHLEKCEEFNEDQKSYLPHHAVIRQDKDTTKVRIVFDASAKGTGGHSLNDNMMVGPVLQSDLRSLIIQWRKHKICIIGDISKMYRMVRMAEIHTNLQCIGWRNKATETLSCYKLNRVTFGTAAAPYLAVRTLIQLADDEGRDCPEAAAAIKHCFYMDDLMAGHENVQGAKNLCRDIKDILQKGGFIMQKWSSNSEKVLKYLQEGKENTTDKLEIKLDKVIKILGLKWDRKGDTFKVTVNLPELRYPVTKRSILSDVARLFDPFGWLSPVVITAKVMIQKLWLRNLGWDDEVPVDLAEEWKRYRKDLTYLQVIEVPRWLHISPQSKQIQIHGFADASTTSYAAVTYVRVVDEQNAVHVVMVACRTKVAPVKQLTVPRLELCAASLLAELVKDVADVLKIPMNNIYAYTDSMVVLSWLQSTPTRWRTFVANRVADIHRVLDSDRWSHVQSAENPADIATRGITATDLTGLEMWWTGPDWLKERKVDISRLEVPETDLEMKLSCHVKTCDEETPLWDRFSTLSKMKRVLAYCRRIIYIKNKVKLEDYLTVNEMEEILEKCIRYYQNFAYEKEIDEIKKKGKVGAKSSLITLAPFLDDKNLLRVGGRLHNAALPEISKHPIIIPKDLHITKLIIQEAHIKTFHGGMQSMMTYIRSKYWVVGLKAAVRKCTRLCRVCIIDKAKTNYQMMGQLPVERVNKCRAFSNSGVDYAGPVQIRTSKGRGHQATKGYICLFVCMSTKALHLEAVTDLTAQGFIAAFRRFVARRGPCAHLWSDNGTNFVGAAKELKELFSKGKANISKEIAELLANDGTVWHFIPPRMPNYGGLWEAGVRSAKRHLARINQGTKLTYEEMATLLSQVEASLNSRPLCQLDDTIETLTPLTPGHFLVGEPLISVPDIKYEEKNINILTRWQMVQRMTQDFWKRWQSEYLNTMQQRYKWQTNVPSPNIGDVVIIKEDDLPPSKWLLGRVKIVHPGSDNLVRVVTVQCKGNHELKRPLSKLIFLPKYINEENKTEGN